MKNFLAKNTYYFISTLFNDEHYIMENISPQDMWGEIEKTLSSLPKLTRVMIILLLLCLSFILPPYGFQIFYKAPLEKRKIWLNSWAESRIVLFKYAFVGVRILLYGSFSQLPPILEKTEYLSTTLKTREHKTTCSEIIHSLYE